MSDITATTSAIAHQRGPTGVDPQLAPSLLHGCGPGGWLQAFLRHARSRVDRVRLGLPLGWRSSTHGISQEEMAQLLGISITWYGALERSGAAWTASQLEKAAEVLGLSDLEREVFYHRTLGSIPRPPVFVDSKTITFIDGLPMPAVLLSDIGQVLHMSATFAEWRWVEREENLYEWVLTDPRAREILVRWESDWRDPIVLDVRRTIAFLPDTRRPTMAALLASIEKKSPDIAKLLIAEHSILQPCGVDIRQVHIAGRGPVSFTLMNAAPANCPGAHVILLNEVC